MNYLLVIVAVVFAVIAQILIKVASTNIFWQRRWIFFMGVSMLCYGIAFVLQSYIYKIFPLSKIAPAMAISIMALVFICGILVFNEQLNTKQLIGVILGFVSIYMILS